MYESESLISRFITYFGNLKFYMCTTRIRFETLIVFFITLHVRYLIHYFSFYYLLWKPKFLHVYLKDEIWDHNRLWHFRNLDSLKLYFTKFKKYLEYLLLSRNCYKWVLYNCFVHLSCYFLNNWFVRSDLSNFLAFGNKFMFCCVITYFGNLSFCMCASMIRFETIFVFL